MLAGQGGRAGTERLGQLQRAQDRATAGFGQALQCRRFDVDRMPRCIAARGAAAGRAHQLLGTGLRPDAGQQRVAGLPHRAFAAVDGVAPVAAHVVVDALGGAAQRQLAQRHQLALAEEVLHRAFGLFRQVDLAFLQAPQQVLGRKIDQHHFVCRIEHPIGNGLPDADAGDAADHVVEAFDVLHIDRGQDVDARGQQFLDVLPTLRVTRAGGIAVRQFIDDQHGRVAGQRGVEVEFAGRRLGRVRAAFGAASWQQLQPLKLRCGLAATVRLDQTDHHVGALRTQLLRGFQHRVGLADAGRCAEEDLQLAPSRPGCFGLRAGEQDVGVGTGRVVGH